MILYEFSALREPERSQFPKVRAFLEQAGMEFNEVAPKMLWCGNIVPDLYIANQLEAVPLGWCVKRETNLSFPSKKSSWPETLTLREQSLFNHGSNFHDTFIEP